MNRASCQAPSTNPNSPASNAGCSAYANAPKYSRPCNGPRASTGNKSNASPTSWKSLSRKKTNSSSRKATRPISCVSSQRGQVGVFKEDSRKDQRRITSLGRGHVFGEMSLIDGEPRSASLYAKSDTVILLVMSKENFRELLEESPRSASRFCGNFHSP
ncbi:MAG: cyclic nucleotide-binding domain-containing protein [Candidatus Sumerlaeia bacterium]